MANYSERDLDIIFMSCRSVLGQPGFAIDCDGRVIRRDAYGTGSEFGWEVDHIHPTALGGVHAIHNVRARHWRGNSVAGGLLGGLLNRGLMNPKPR